MGGWLLALLAAAAGCVVPSHPKCPSPDQADGSPHSEPSLNYVPNIQPANY